MGYEYNLKIYFYFKRINNVDYWQVVLILLILNLNENKKHQTISTEIYYVVFMFTLIWIEYFLILLIHIFLYRGSIIQNSIFLSIHFCVNKNTYSNKMQCAYKKNVYYMFFRHNKKYFKKSNGINFVVFN